MANLRASPTTARGRVPHRNPRSRPEAAREPRGIRSLDLSDPEAWRAIARLGGRPTWVLRRAGGMFVDVHSLRSDRRALGTVVRWARRRGYLERGRLVQLHCQNDAGEDILQFFASRADAEAERAALGDHDAIIDTSIHYLVTAAMAERAMALNRDDHALALDHAVSFFVEDCLPHVDGLGQTVSIRQVCRRHEESSLPRAWHGGVATRTSTAPTRLNPRPCRGAFPGAAA